MTGQDEMVDVLCEWRNADRYHHTLGGASLNGNMKILDLYPSDQGATHNTWILFGDPSLMMRTATPSEMNVVCEPEAIFLGQTELTITANADYAMATLSYNGEVLANAQGRVAVHENPLRGVLLLVLDPDEVGSLLPRQPSWV